MTDKTALDLFLENVSFISVKRDILGEATESAEDLKKELFYYKSQASHGPEKSRAAMASKAKEIEAEIEKTSTPKEAVEEKTDPDHSGDKIFKFTAENGIPFVARRVDAGDRYGLHDKLVHDKEEPLIEFYDARYPHTKFGQFVSRYYLKSLLNKDQNRGLILHGGEPNWQIGKEDLQKVLKSLSGSIKEQSQENDKVLDNFKSLLKF